jgi:excisionase family DNA binding protein
MFGVSRSTIVRAYQAGEFPAVKFRGTYRVPRRFVDDFLAAAVRGRVIVLEEYAAEWLARNPATEVA